MIFRAVFAACAAALHRARRRAALAGAPLAGTAPSSASLFNLEAEWTNQDGALVALSAFAGRPAIVAMGYTTCKDICPAIVADMMWIEKHLPPGGGDRVRFAFFSFDSEADTPERLKTLRRQPRA